ncbi:hypothetical protein [Vibrio sp. 10N.261.51.F12]|uniref:hypothetical protein n=1 Tax=Vibrio sp. 10N.261.51.F12 TaxID=3229679 RepID=UPI00354F8B9C
MSQETTLKNRPDNKLDNDMGSPNTDPVRPSPWKGRLTLVVLTLFFALPFIFAKTILSNHWYQSGATNHGALIEPRMTFTDLGLINPLQQESWQLGYVMPSVCGDVCQNRLYVMGQTYIALGKYKERVTPVVYVFPGQAIPDLPSSVMRIEVNPQFVSVVPKEGYIIVDTLGQMVMSFAPVDSEYQAANSKGLLSDLRKMLKLSRVG